MSAAPVTLAKCSRCDEPSAILECRDCSAEMWTPDDCGQQEARDEELDDVLEFLKQKAVDAYRLGSSNAVDDALAQLRLELERGEHRA
jgi:primosomal protein N'